MNFLMVGLAVLNSGALLWAEHYSPWQAWIGRELPRPAAYAFGLIALLFPLFILWTGWILTPPEGNVLVWVMASLALNVVTGGITVFGLYLADHSNEASQRAKSAEKAEEIWRDDTHE